MAQPNGLNPSFDTVNAKKKVIQGQGATATLSQGDSGSTVLFDRAAGIIFTLPAPVVGTVFDFIVKTTITSNNAKIITNTGTVFLQGGYINVDTDTSNAVAAFTGNGTTHVAVTMNGTTTGAVAGTALRFECVSATMWQVSGIVLGTGTVATAFATS